ncbi:MAG: YggS family pyridoxal phosphate-dependent enzyme [Elusimicrobiota bacterium]|jgi:pyridoxal phosphate enzyme (YggS family)|nr:YggS family pyridoxal phosphate-dependent enzyme [Elusimicrobiota bacterium]
MENINKNIRIIHDTINSMVSRSIELVAVTKTFPSQYIVEALKCGVKHIGESRIQEALPKFEQVGEALKGAKKHFIGHLQTNKAKKAVENFDLIQSLDSLDLAHSINKHALSCQKIQECLIEVKVSGESSKTGISPENVKDFYCSLCKFSNIAIRGLMIIPPLLDDIERSRAYFKQGYTLFNEMKEQNDGFDILSMGMSDDYKIAIEEGSNMIRIGSAIFGSRVYGNC